MVASSGSARRDFDHDDDLRGVVDPDFLALGLGGANMMSMLWAVACGRRAVGVEMRGDPFLGVHWNLRVDLYHQLGLIDRMMLERYGEDGVPRRANGMRFNLAECFYDKRTVAGDIVADEIIDGFDTDQHIVGTIHHVEFVDDRWRHGLPNRVVTLLQPPVPPDAPQPELIRTDMVEVLDGPSTFQAGAASILVLLRRYLEAIEAMDLADPDRTPRVRLFIRHRVIPGAEGFVRDEDGRLSVTIEALQELDYRGKFLRVRMPGSHPIHIGVPELCMIAEGFHSTDAQRLGFEQRDVAVDHGDGRGPVVAQADFLAGLIEVLVGGRLRRRIASAFDHTGKEYWTRQIAVGHENDPEVGWVLVQVPDFKTFDPVEAGLIGADVDQDTPEFFAAYQQLVYDYYMEQASEVLELPVRDLKRVQMVYGPKLFSLIERTGENAQIAANAVVAGDSFGNGHFLTSGGAMTGMIGHSAAALRYFEARAAGRAADEAIRALADEIQESTEAWLRVSATEYSQALPINFGKERIDAIAASSGADAGARAEAIDATRRQRHSLLPLDPSDWRRLFLRNGRVMSAPLPQLHAMHPALRQEQAKRPAGRIAVVFLMNDASADAVEMLAAIIAQPGANVGVLATCAEAAIPERLRDRLAGFAQVGGFDAPAELAARARSLHGGQERPHALFAQPELSVAAAEVRLALGLGGMHADVVRSCFDASRVAAILREHGVPFSIDGGGHDDFSLEVMSIGGAPAWACGIRRRMRGPRDLLCATLPLEQDDPADPQMRRMGYAALRAIGMDTGLATLRWHGAAGGTSALTAIAPHGASADVLTLLGLAHGANIWRAEANLGVNRSFAPMPRLLASGLALAPPSLGALDDAFLDGAVAGLEGVSYELRPAQSGPEFKDWTAVFLRAPQTGTIDAALERIAAAYA